MKRAALALCFGFLASMALGQDLDVAGAKAKYDRQRTLADAARARMDVQAKGLQEAENRLSQAQNVENRARSDRDNARYTLETLEARIPEIKSYISAVESDITGNQNYLSSLDNKLAILDRDRNRLERQAQNIDQRLQNILQRIAEEQAKPNHGPWTCVSVDRGWEEHSGGHPATHRDRAEAEKGANEACLAVHGTCRLSGCSQPESQALKNLYERKANVEEEKRINQQELASNQQEIYQAQSERQRILTHLQNKGSELSRLQSDLSQAERDRDRQVRVLADAEAALRRAEGQTDYARQEVAAARPPYLTAKAEYEYQESLAQEAYSYYQQVVANYNAALNEVYLLADNAAYRDGGLEAADRAPAAGATDGTKMGALDGTQKGKSDAAARDLFKGYQTGRATASTDSKLKASYSDGLGLGTAAARATARAENYPLGYNEALKAHLASVPAKQAEIDITESLPSFPGGSGDFLNMGNLTVGQGTAPQANQPKEPAYVAPTSGTPSVGVPSTLKTYYSPPCSGLVLAEFEPLCRSRYDSSYQSQFSTQYRRLYSAEYLTSYKSKAASSYQSALAPVDGASLQTGLQRGAKDQGLLDAYAQNLPALRLEEHRLGAEAFAAHLLKGASLVVRSVSLQETTGDGLLTPGEAATLTLVVDNYGAEASALGGTRIRVRGRSGLGAVSVELRELPALEGGTRTTLKGVLSAPITTEAPQDKMELEVSLDLKVGGQWKEANRLTAEGITAFPLELSEITLPKNPKVGEKVQAQFTFINRTATALTNAKAKLDSSPQFVLFSKPEVELPELAAGQSVALPVEIEAGPWVGDNTYVNFTAQTTFDQGKQGVQALRKYLTIDRPVSLLLFDSAGKAVPSSTLSVRAGSVLTLHVQLAYKVKHSLPGPFSVKSVKSAKTSVPQITHANGSTTGVNYGSLSPTYPLSKIRMSYQIPASLKGKREWIMITATEGSKTQHALMVYLDIQ